MVARILFDKIAKSSKSVLLLGPRQVGKSTLCQQLKPDLTINLSDQEQFNKHLRDVSLIKRLVSDSEKKLIVIDEIQRLPEMLNTIQFLIDNNPDKRFILTGSSARKLKRGNANLLPGRVLVMNLSPLVYWEVVENFDLLKALTRGMLPEIYLKKDLEQVLYSYTNTYLREEIQAEALTKNLAAYSRFLDLAAVQSGLQINYTKLASDAEINKETTRRYFSILEDTLIIEKIPSYTSVQSKRRAQQKERFVFFDLGVCNAILRRVNNHFSDTELGKLFEQWFALQCIYYNKMMFCNWSITSFRTDAGDEVDLLIETQDRIIAIEIKYSQILREESTKGLKFFSSAAKSFNAKKKVETYIVYLGADKQVFADGTIAVNYQDFLINIENLV